MGSNRKPTRYAHSSGHTDVCFSEDGQKLITCGTDGDMRMWASIDDYDPFQTCVGEWSLCVRQKGDKILIATDNNSVQLLTYPGGERDTILTRCSAPVTHMAVGKDHNFVAIASEDMEVKVMNLSSTEETPKTFSGLTGPPLSIALCPKAQILAVSAGDGFLRFWDVATSNILKELECVAKANSFANATLLCRMDFEPSSGQYVAYPQNNTIVVVKTSDWSSAYTLTSDPTDSPLSIVQYSPCGKFIAASTNKGDIVVWDMESQSIVESSSHPMSKAVSALVWNPAVSGEIAFCDVEGQLGVVDCTSNLSRKEDEVVEKGDEVIEKGDDIDFGDIQFEDDGDNLSVVSIENLKSGMGLSDNEDGDKVSSVATPRALTPEIPMQLAFMPSSTPDHLDPRYLCWNEVGVVRSYGATNEGDGNKSIEAEFHDTTFHSSMMMQNFNNYTMASLSTSVLTLADSHQIQVISLLSGVKDWMLSVEEHLNIVCIAASSKLVCFVTSNYFVHVCTSYGTQKCVFSVPGPVVCMSAYNNLLLIAYHSSKPRGEDQCIQFMLLKLEGMTIHKTDLNSTLQPECTLYWMGFTDSGSPVVLDSNEMLFIYLTGSNVWVPICDLTTHTVAASDGFFVTAVSESTATVRGIRCKCSKYPTFVPRPMLSELPLQPVFAEIASEKAQLGANLFMWTNLRVEDTEKKCKEAALKSFALACKNSLDQRAFELIELVQNKQVINLAIKYASKLNKNRLVEKLTELQTKLQPNDGNEAPCELPPSDHKTTIKPDKRLTLPVAERSTPKNRHRKQPNTESIQYTPENGNVHSLPSTSAYSLDGTFGSSAIFGRAQEFSATRNPFAKHLKNTAPSTPNPLSLTDRRAGYEMELKQNIFKRKQPEASSGTAYPRERQPKLARFSFGRNT